MELYSDRNPQTTIKGFGYANAKKARATLKKLKKVKRPEVYKFQVVNTMYYRAKHHKYRTKDMEAAMKVFKKYLDRRKTKKLRKKKK
tara:strand:- start:2044 stop:2304 length:261 start_codon:yes stop_codon:yes gene_type:complete